MRLPASPQSLRFRVTVGILLPLLVILASFSYLQYLRHRDLLIQNLQRTASQTADIVESSLRHAMMNNDRVLLSRMVLQIARQRNVQDLFLLDKLGEIAIASEPQGIGKVLDIKDPTCQACHARPQATQTGALVVTDESGRRVLRQVKSIVKGRQCQNCHERLDETYGILIIDYSMQDLEAQLAGERAATIAWTLGALFLLAIAISSMMRRLIVRPLERLTDVVRRVGRGELSHRTGLSGKDEIGELARTFDRMAEGLEGKAVLEREVRQHTQALQIERDKLATLNMIAGTVSRSLHLEEVLASSLEVVLELLGLRAGWISLCDQASGQFHLVVSRGVSPAFVAEERSRPPELCANRMVQETATHAIVEDIARCRRLSPAVAQGEGLSCHACIPLVAKGQVLGILNVAAANQEHTQCFTDDRLQLLMAIGQQIGVAIENARLYEELQQKEALRGQVIEKLLTVQEEERRRIARELHDQTSQSLTSLLVGLKMLGQATDSPLVRERVSSLRAIAAQALEGVHDLAVQLRPSVLDDMGLVAATQHTATTFAGHLGIQVHFQAIGFEDRRLPAAVETTLYRIVQEALTNVAKHAHARNVDILLRCHGDTVLALVEDDGSGFDVAAALAQGGSRHLGLFGMRERAELVGGHLTVESSPTGTTVVVEIPLAQNEYLSALPERPEPVPQEPASNASREDSQFG